jgi:hypothetical protein
MGGGWDLLGSTTEKPARFDRRTFVLSTKEES